MSHVAVIDTGLCNLDSIVRAIEECGGRAQVTAQPGDLASATRIILPGVGAFPEAMARLRARGLVEALNEHVVEHGVPFLGVCLGMQLMATRGFEGKETAGLGWVDGEVHRIEPRPGERIPHIGWNDVEPTDNAPLFAGIPPGRDFYFVHSYALQPASGRDVAAFSPYGGRFVSAVTFGNRHGVQFHPEKSQGAGFAVLRNFLSI